MKEKSLKQNNLKVCMWLVIGFAAVMVLPLYWIAVYNYPTSDDFAYADSIYWNLKNGAGFLQIVRDAWAEAMRFYRDWQGRYFDDIVSAFGFGIAVPQLYFLGTYLVLTLFIAASIGFLRKVAREVLWLSSEKATIVAVLITLMEVLYVPYPDEAFYWYVGATGYTGSYALFLLLMICNWNMADRLLRKEKRGFVTYFILTLLLVVMIGGTNYAVALLAAEYFVLVLLYMLYRYHGRWGSRKNLWITQIVLTVCYGIAFSFNAFSKGNHARMSNVTGLSPVQSILESLHRGGVFIGEWFHLYVLLLLVVVAIISYEDIKKSKFRFRLPGLVTLITFGLFSSIMTPPLFADGTWGPGRLINVLYYSYYSLLVGNMLYWMGWLQRRVPVLKGNEEKTQKSWIVPVTLAVAAVLFVGLLKVYGLQSTNSTSALLSIMKGEAATYKAENIERWRLYDDESIQDVEVADFTVKPRVLYHDDVSTDANDWRNWTTLGFFKKQSIRRIN